jgi:L-asparaginase II
MMSVPHVEMRLRCYAHKFAAPEKLETANKVFTTVAKAAQQVCDWLIASLQRTAGEGRPCFLVMPCPTLSLPLPPCWRVQSMPPAC